MLPILRCLLWHIRNDKLPFCVDCRDCITCAGFTILRFCEIMLLVGARLCLLCTRVCHILNSFALDAVKIKLCAAIIVSSSDGSH